MSELKEYIAPTPDGTGLAYYYLKSEADKAIAEKDEEIYNIKYSRDEWAKACNQKDKEIAELEKRIDDGDKDFEMANNQNERLLKIVRHQKYKRCLAMAKWCDAQVEWYNSLNEDYSFWLDLYVKWHNRWLELAERCKEAK